MLEFHPDKNNRQNATEKTQQLLAAYEHLKKQITEGKCDKCPPTPYASTLPEPDTEPDTDSRIVKMNEDFWAARKQGKQGTVFHVHTVHPKKYKDLPNLPEHVREFTIAYEATCKKRLKRVPRSSSKSKTSPVEDSMPIQTELPTRRWSRY